LRREAGAVNVRLWPLAIVQADSTDLRPARPQAPAAAVDEPG